MTGRRSYVVGLTGGIASGKSTVASAFAERGVPVLSADIAAREVVEPGSEGLARLVESFGAAILAADGSLDRRRLREIAFADTASRQRLEAILHPLIRRRLLDQLAQVQAPYTVLEVPLLVESDFVRLVDRILVVDVPVELQRQRVMQRDRCGAEQADAIIASQSSRERRLAAADDVLLNTGDLAALQARVDQLHAHYLQLAATH